MYPATIEVVTGIIGPGAVPAPLLAGTLVDSIG